jgi:hypothetical protein
MARMASPFCCGDRKDAMRAIRSPNLISRDLFSFCFFGDYEK